MVADATIVAGVIIAIIVVAVTTVAVTTAVITQFFKNQKSRQTDCLSFFL